jgi:hypothetical protein
MHHIWTRHGPVYDNLTYALHYSGILLERYLCHDQAVLYDGGPTE